MKTRLALVVLIALAVMCATAHAQSPSLIGIQGKLTDSAGTPLTPGDKSFTFKIFNSQFSPSGQIWAETQTIATDTEGLWGGNLGATVPLGEQFFSEAERWLEISVNPGGGAVTLPRVRMVTAPYAHHVTTLDNATGGSIKTNVAIGTGSFAGGISAFAVGYNALSDGSYSTVGGGYYNEATGNNATVGGGAYCYARGVNSVVSGGGSMLPGDSNVASGTSAVLGGGDNNLADGWFSTIAGGYFNWATGDFSTIGGGQANMASGDSATVGGGSFNHASDNGATVGGGVQNDASGLYATIPGGRDCTASGNYTFAAGRRAKAVNAGSFVWGGRTDADFSSTGLDQFLIRASGGVGIGTDSPQASLHLTSGPNNISLYLTASSGSDIAWAAGNNLQLGEWDGGAFTERARFNGSGHLGLGTTSAPDLLTLPNIASAEGSGLAYAWDTYSSRRWKEHIKTLDRPLDQIERLRGVSFDWKQNGRHDIGLIAEEVGEVIPEVVTYEANGVDAQSVDYARLVALLIEGMKQQQEEINQLKQTVARLTQ